MEIFTSAEEFFFGLYIAMNFQAYHWLLFVAHEIKRDLGFNKVFVMVGFIPRKYYYIKIIIC
jgi:hypothetical protein